ncbi:MAG: hypothetical protein C4523_15490 [Myxococcales bacterium]|nr:MAG: hypothetical protein C4523_15490 [Myxococcales bacterium]
MPGQTLIMLKTMLLGLVLASFFVVDGCQSSGPGETSQGDNDHDSERVDDGDLGEGDAENTEVREEESDMPPQTDGDQEIETETGVDIDREPDRDPEPDGDDSCVPCANGVPLRCGAGEAANTCVLWDCMNGCEREVARTPEGQYGYCDGARCVDCLAMEAGLFRDCEEPAADGDADLDSVAPEGVLSGKGPRGHLQPTDDWVASVMPGERRLSQFGLEDGLDPHDIDGDRVVWCHGQTGRMFTYQASENWFEELTIDGVEHLCWWVSVDGNVVYSTATSKDQLSSRDIFAIDIVSRRWKRLDNVTDQATSVWQINADHGRVTWGHEMIGYYSQIALYDINGDEFSVLTQESYPQQAPRLSDKYLVWIYQRSDWAYEVWLYDLFSHETRSLTPTDIYDSTARGVPMAFSHFVVWSTYNTEDLVAKKVFLYDISTDQTTQLETAGEASGIWGDSDRLVWADSSINYQFRIRLKDMAKEETTWVTNDTWTGTQSLPKLSGRWLVYAETDRFPLPQGFNRGWDLVLFDLCTLDLYKNDPMCQ